MASVVVMGLGYVGRPLAVAIAHAGHLVTGLDVDPARVDALRSAGFGADEHRDPALQPADADLAATTDPTVIGRADVVLICVPTGLGTDGNPDTSHLREAVNTIGRHLTTQTLVVLVSTSHPGTTTDLVAQVLAEHGFVVGDDLWVAVSPERGSPGESALQVGQTPRVVGGVTAECASRAFDFFGTFVPDLVLAAGPAEAELSKLLENSFRLINIALVNQLLPICHDLRIDLWNAIDCAATKPQGFLPFRPGPGAGGHCIPVDPLYLSRYVEETLGEPMPMIELAVAVNTRAPLYVADRVTELLKRSRGGVSDAQVLLLGVTYKADVDDLRETPAAPLARRLEEDGVRVTYHDPFVDAWAPSCSMRWMDRAADPYAAAAAADITVLLQPHRSYELRRLAATARLLLDTHGVLRGEPGVDVL